MYFSYIIDVFTLRDMQKTILEKRKSSCPHSSDHTVSVFDKFNDLTDSRKHKEYSMAEIVTGALPMYIFKETLRNANNNDWREDCFRKNVFKYFRLNLPHADTIDDVLRKLPPVELEVLKAYLVSGPIEQKLLRKFRFMGKSYLVAVDATGIATFDQKHCGHCLTKTSKTGVATYFHYVLEAKLVTSTGLAISLARSLLKTIRDYENRTANKKLSCVWR